MSISFSGARAGVGAVVVLLIAALFAAGHYRGANIYLDNGTEPKDPFYQNAQVVGLTDKPLLVTGKLGLNLPVDIYAIDSDRDQDVTVTASAPADTFSPESPISDQNFALALVEPKNGPNASVGEALQLPTPDDEHVALSMPYVSDRNTHLEKATLVRMENTVQATLHLKKDQRIYLVVLDATLTTTNPNATPSLDSWSVSYDYGPTPLPGVTFTITSTKTIGSGPAGPVYKVRATSTTDANAQYAFPNIEWDTYTLASGSTTLDIASACNPQPEYIAPGANQTTALFFLPHTTNSLLVDVKDASGNTISGASVRLYRTKSPASDTTILSDTCGNTFFSTMAQGTASGNNAYSISVSATGHTTYTSTSVNVQGASRLSVVLN
jgi:hypothetical protein